MHPFKLSICPQLLSVCGPGTGLVPGCKTWFSPSKNSQPDVEDSDVNKIMAMVFDRCTIEVDHLKLT